MSDKRAKKFKEGDRVAVYGPAAYLDQHQLALGVKGTVLEEPPYGPHFPGAVRVKLDTPLRFLESGEDKVFAEAIFHERQLRKLRPRKTLFVEFASPKLGHVVGVYEDRLLSESLARQMGPNSVLIEFREVRKKK